MFGDSIIQILDKKTIRNMVQSTENKGCLGG
jgi:hypothetical protein